MDVAGQDLKAEEMIKLPVQVTSFSNTDWHHTLGQAHAKLEELDNEAVSLQNSEGRYIRPIAVVRVERTGNDQRDGERIHSEDVREYLTQNMGVPAESVAVQSSTSHELDGVDLLSEFSSVRWIITKAALMEGWDCPFAYLLVMLDNTSARRAITQLVGRVMRQPHARLTYREALDQCYVYCQSTDVSDAVQYVKDALEQEGMGDLDDDVHTSQATDVQDRHDQSQGGVQGRSEIFLPKVLHKKTRRRMGGTGLPAAHPPRNRPERHRLAGPPERAPGPATRVQRDRGPRRRRCLGHFPQSSGRVRR